MSDNKRHAPYDSQDPLMDTQRLLQGLEPMEDAGFSLEDILAEYGGGSSAAADVPAAPRRQAEPASERLTDEAKADVHQAGRKTIPFPGSVHIPEEKGALSKDEASAPVLRPDNEIDEISPEALFGIEFPEGAEPARAEDTREFVQEDEQPAASDRNAADEPQGEGFLPISMEDIVASTVDAVKEEQQKKQEKLLKKLEKERKKRAPKAVKRKTPVLQAPLPEIEDEPQPGEGALWHKRRYNLCKKGLLFAVPMLILLWLPWLLTQFGVQVPFFGDSVGNTAVFVLVPQMMLCMSCWPVFRSALDGLRERSFTAAFLAALSNVVTLLDEITLLFLPEREAVAPLGGVAAVGLVFALWGMAGYHKGMWETFRTAAMGEPNYLVDCNDAGIAKGRGRRAGFCTRVNMEDTASQWQRLLTPVLAVATLVFAVLASVGQGRGQNLLWCWSAILCTTSSLVYPLAYFVPFGRLASRLNRSGAAVAGQYGAAALSASRQIVVTDGDLFPQGTVALNGLKLYGEERNHAISYAATLAVHGGGCLGRVFDEICRSERIAYQPLEHFHIHDDNGLSGMIRGETVLVGTPVFMRHKAVRLPPAMPSRTCVCLAVDGELTAVFAVKYNTSDLVESALRALGRNDLQLMLAVRDGNITPKLLKTRFGTDGGAVYPETSERLNLSDPEREAEGPNGLLYRDGLYPFVDLVAGSRRLCHVVRIGNLLSIFSSVFGALLSFYLSFAESYHVLTPVLLATYLLLWVVPMLPLLWGVDRT